MSNTVEIQVTGRDDSAAALAAARAGMKRVESAAKDTQRATASLTSAQTRLAAAQGAAASIAEKLARGEITEAEAAQRSAAAARELEHAFVYQAAASRIAAAATDHLAAQERQLARDTSRAGRQADASGNMVKKMFSSLTTAGTDAMQGLGKSMSEAFSNGPVMIGGIILGLAALPVLAVAAGGAVTLGLGAALAAVAVMAVKNNSSVKASFTSLKTHVVSELARMAQPFVPVLTHIADVARHTFDALGPSLTGAFKTMAPAVTYFMTSLGQSLTRLGPTIGKVAQEFDPLMRALGDAMPGIIDNIASGIESIVSAVAGHESDFAGFVTGLSEIVKWAGAAVGALGDVFNVVAGYKSMGQLIGYVKDQLGGAAKGWSEASQASWDAQGGFAAASTAMDLATMSADQLKSALDALSGGQLGARAAARDFQKAIDDMSKSLAKNGHTFNINTDAGRKNQAALDKIAETGIAASEALKKVDASGKSSAASMNDTRAKYIAAAIAGGMNRASAIKLADAMGLVATRANQIPSQTDTKILGNVHDLEAKIARAKAQLRTVPPSRRAAILANIADLQRKVAAAKAQLNSIHNKTVYVTTIGQSFSVSTHAAVGRAMGGIVGGMASGGAARGSMGSGVTTLVGEDGPEMVNLPFGSTVTPAGQTAARLAGGGGGGGGHFTVEWIGGNSGDAFLTWLKSQIRIKAGGGSNSVQRVLGA